jgi:N-acetyl sugar amidotransferase
MDTTDSSITFDENGVCNHCLKYDEVIHSYPYNSQESIDLELEKMVSWTKKNGQGKPYDCVIGVSGGVDSTYLAYIAKEKGLRPIAVHLDNGWNSELAVHNIEKVLKNLGIDLLTHVLEWDEFKDLQIAFLKASVSDAEIPTDHAISGILYKVARKYGIKTILLGTNISTESGLPFAWTYGVSDWMYINGIHKKFGTRKLSNYPHFRFIDEFYWKVFCGIKVFPILDFVPYNKADALDVLQNKLGWQYYGGKHYESIYTRFFQGYILPKKFNIDKRRAHYSSLIRSGQIIREKALEEMAAPTYPEDMQRDDREYVIKKLCLTEQEFDAIMAAPVKSYRDYPNYYNLAAKSIGFEQARKIVRRIRSL